MPTAATYGSLPFPEQIAFFRQKALTPTRAWTDVWRDAHDSSFMVAGAANADLLQDFHDAIDQVVSEGKTLRDFGKDFDRIVEQYGWDYKGGRDWRVRTIYQTNLRQSYNAGREVQMADPEVRRARPYGLYRHGDSRVPRPLHLSWDGLVLPLDDPWWDTHSPQNGWGCTCKKFSLGPRDLEKRGLKVADQAPDNGVRDWVDKATGEVHQVPNGIDPGFDYRPGATRVDRLRQQLVTGTARLDPELARSVLADLERIPAAPMPPEVPPLGLVDGQILRQGEVDAIANAAGLEPVQAEALADYLGNGRKSINRALAGLSPMQRMDELTFARYTDALDSAIERLPRSEYSQVVRIMGGNPAEVDAFVSRLAKLQGSEWTTETYLSTSGPGGAYDPGSVKAIIKIKAQPGSAQSGKIGDLAGLPEEQEILFKRGSRFRVSSVSRATAKKPALIVLEEGQ